MGQSVSGEKGSRYHIVPISVTLFHKDRGGALHDRTSCSQIQCRTDRWMDRMINWWWDGYMEGYSKAFVCVSVCPPLTRAVSAGYNTASLTNTLTWSQTQQLPGVQCNCLLAAWAELKSRGVTECVNMCVKKMKRVRKSSREKQTR